MSGLAAGGYTAADSAWNRTALGIATAMAPAIIATDLRPLLPAARRPLLTIATARFACSRMSRLGRARSLVIV